MCPCQKTTASEYLLVPKLEIVGQKSADIYPATRLKTRLSEKYCQGSNLNNQVERHGHEEHGY